MADLRTDENVPSQERTEAEKARTHPDERWRILFEYAPDAAYLLDLSGTIVEGNRSAEALVKYQKEELIGKNLFQLNLLDPPDLARVEARLARNARGEATGPDEFTLRAKDGTRVVAEIRTYPVPVPGQVLVLGIARDITERKRIEAPLLWSSEVYRIFGVSETQSTASIQDFFAMVHPEDRQRVQALSQAAVERGLPYELDHRIVRPDGTVRWVHEKAEVMRDPQGHPLRMVGVVQDITERKRLEEQLRQAVKMEAIGQLAGGVAHDFNNILAATLMHLGLLRQSPQLIVGTKESLKEVEREVMRAASLTRQLLLFSRRQMARVEPLDLDALIHDLLRMLRRLLGENIEVVFQRSTEAVWVRADAGMMEQVVMNLCINSRDAMPRGGRLTLGTSLVELQSESVRPDPDARPGRFVCLCVTDTGSGMDEAVLRHVFEPFFTTKEPGKGTGLGLAMVYGIIKQHEGWIEVDSEPRKGSSFCVYLPALAPPAEKAPPVDLPDEVPRGSETILLVEDDLPVRRMVALCLRTLGYAVLEAANATEALQVWEQHHRHIKLLLTDMVMPGQVTGLELAQRLREEKADLRVMISSGYSAEPAPSPSVAQQQITCLAKPHKVVTLAKVVRQCLDDQPGAPRQSDP